MGIVDIRSTLLLSLPALCAELFELNQQAPLFSGCWLGLANGVQWKEASKQMQEESLSCLFPGFPPHLVKSCYCRPQQLACSHLPQDAF